MRSETYKITGLKPGDDHSKLLVILKETERIASLNELDAKRSMQLRLIAEELMNMVTQLMDFGEGSFWLENYLSCYELHFRVKPKKIEAIDKSSERKGLGRVFGRKQAKTDKSIEKHSMMRRIVSEVEKAINTPLPGGSSWSLNRYVTDLKESDKAHKTDAWDELEKSIIANLANDITVSAADDEVELVVIKDFSI